MAASVNPGDVKNVAGQMEHAALPRVPGRDFSGIVEHGPVDWIGAHVWGTGGEIGFTEDGTHAELIAFPVGALVRKPSSLNHEEASAIGVNFIIAWLGLVEYGAPKPGETVAIISIGGGVGGAVAQIAKVLTGVEAGPHPMLRQSPQIACKTRPGQGPDWRRSGPHPERK
jgi:NADPH:quinone reductase-like Zn-dependent oxidoreductase